VTNSSAENPLIVEPSDVVLALKEEEKSLQKDTNYAILPAVVFLLLSGLFLFFAVNSDTEFGAEIDSKLAAFAAVLCFFMIIYALSSWMKMKTIQKTLKIIEEEEWGALSEELQLHLTNSVEKEVVMSSDFNLKHIEWLIKNDQP